MWVNGFWLSAVVQWFYHFSLNPYDCNECSIIEPHVILALALLHDIKLCYDKNICFSLWNIWRIYPQMLAMNTMVLKVLSKILDENGKTKGLTTGLYVHVFISSRWLTFSVLFLFLHLTEAWNPRWRSTRKRPSRKSSECQVNCH